MERQSQPPAIDEPQSVLEKTLSAGYWSLLDTILQKVLIYGSFFITARLLSPADYGVIALAMVYPNLLDSLTAIAYDTALTQTKEGQERGYLSVVWTFNLIRSCVVFVIVFFSAHLFTDFFHAQNAVLLFQLSALPLLLQSLANIGQIYFFRNLNFKKVFVRDMASYGTNAITTILLAFFFHSYWALFIGSVAGMLAAVTATYALQEFRPTIDLSFRKLRPLLNYSQWVFGQGLLSRLGQTLEDTVVGHFTDPSSVGNFSKAKSLAYAPTSPLANIIGKVGFSALVATEGSLVHVREGFYKSFNLATTIALPFAVTIWIFGAEFIHIVLGAKWIGITPLIQTLVIVSGLNASILSLTGMTMNAIGKPSLQFRLHVLSLTSTVLFLPLLVMAKGVIGASQSLLIVSVIVNGYALFLVGATIAPSWKRLVETITVATVSATMPLVIALPLLHNTLTTSHTTFFLSICILYGILYGACIILIGKITNKGPLQTLLVIAGPLLKKRRGKLS